MLRKTMFPKQGETVQKSALKRISEGVDCEKAAGKCCQ